MCGGCAVPAWACGCACTGDCFGLRPINSSYVYLRLCVTPGISDRPVTLAVTVAGTFRLHGNSAAPPKPSESLGKRRLGKWEAPPRPRPESFKEVVGAKRGGEGKAVVSPRGN